MSLSGPARRGLRESHAHLAALGEALRLPSLESCTSVEECLKAAGRAAATARGGWARLHSARAEGWEEGRWPTRAELDAATGATPTVIMSFDLHHALANTAALARVGADAGAGVEVDPSSGRPTGQLREGAAYRAWEAGPPPTAAEQREGVRAAVASLAALGYAEVHDLHSQEWLGDVLRQLDDAGELPVAVRLYPPAALLAGFAARRGAFESARVRLAGGKVFADGTLNGRTAYLLHRYSLPLADLPRGQCLVAPAALEATMREADALGLPLAVHAIGDAAVRLVLDVVERVRPRAAGQRIEHAEIIDAVDVPRFAELGVSCGVQPCHLLADVEALRRYVPHRLNRVLPLRDLLASGLAPGVLGDDEGAVGAGLVFGSDVPIVRADPEDSIRAAVERRRAGAPPSEAIAPAQAITEAEAWACFGGGVR